jgi:hypothetical protein
MPCHKTGLFFCNRSQQKVVDITYRAILVGAKYRRWRRDFPSLQVRLSDRLQDTQRVPMFLATERFTLEGAITSQPSPRQADPSLFAIGRISRL